jgi:hypothetical protein
MERIVQAHRPAGRLNLCRPGCGLRHENGGIASEARNEEHNGGGTERHQQRVQQTLQ